MSVQLKKSKAINIRRGVTAGAVILGAGYLIFTTFPHLKTAIYNTLTGTKSSEEEEEDNLPIELKQPSNDSKDIDSSVQIINGEESIVNVEEWSDENLKSWLSEKEITPPSNASHNNLVSLVNSIKENST